MNGTVLDKTSNLVNCEKNVLNKWKQCFDELLNVECEPSVNETITKYFQARDRERNLPSHAEKNEMVDQMVCYFVIVFL